MGKEQVRISVLIEALGVSVNVMQFVGGFTVPRRTIGQLKDVHISALTMKDYDGLTDIRDVLIAGLVRGRTGRPNLTFTPAGWDQIDTIVSDMVGIKVSGLAVAGTIPVPTLRIQEDFIDDDPRTRVNNRSGPNTNLAQGFQFFLTAAGNDATTAFMVGTMTIELDWPKHKTAVLAEEHIANMENQ